MIWLLPSQGLCTPLPIISPLTLWRSAHIVSNLLVPHEAYAQICIHHSNLFWASYINSFKIFPISAISLFIILPQSLWVFPPLRCLSCLFCFVPSDSVACEGLVMPWGQHIYLDGCSELSSSIGCPEPTSPSGYPRVIFKYQHVY